MRFDPVFSDIERGNVGKRAFQTVANLNEDLAVLRENEQYDAVALFFLSNAPGLRDSLGVSSNVVVALHLWKDRDHDLVRRFALELGELFVESQRSFF